MSIELTTAEQEVLSRIGATLSPPVLTELPEADAEKAGEQFWLNGTLSTYNKAGQFGTLAEGEPWPVKGYKEWTFNIQQGSTNAPVIIVRKNDGYDITVTEITRVAVGSYYFKVGLNDTQLFRGRKGELIHNYQGSINTASGLETGVFFFDYINGPPSIEAAGIRIKQFNASGAFDGIDNATFGFKEFPPTN